MLAQRRAVGKDLSSELRSGCVRLEGEGLRDVQLLLLLNKASCRSQAWPWGHSQSAGPWEKVISSPAATELQQLHPTQGFGTLQPAHLQASSEPGSAALRDLPPACPESWRVTSNVTPPPPECKSQA